MRGTDLHGRTRTDTDDPGWRRACWLAVVLGVAGWVWGESRTLMWDPASPGSDGAPSPVQYRLYRGTASGVYRDVLVTLEPAGRMGLEWGTNYFAVTSVSAEGMESEYSNEVAVTNGSALRIVVWLEAADGLGEPWLEIGALECPQGELAGQRFYRARLGIGQ